MDEAIQDGVCIGRIADQLVPVLNGYLAGDESRLPAIAIFQDFHQIVPGIGIERFEPSVVENQELWRDQAAQQPPVSPVGPGKGQVGEHIGCALW